MTIMFLSGRVTTSSYEKMCSDNNQDPANRKCIFIFPGNGSHHTQRHTLFSVKSGSGLAAASAAIGNAGYPTLSLPTTGMENWASNSQQQGTVHGALQDLYKAVGAGYHLILPVREHADTEYFDQGLFPNGVREPNFWGGAQKEPNKPLANYYTQQLDDLYRFLALSVESRDEKAQADPEHPFYQAYLQGQRMGADDPWLRQSSKQGSPKKPVVPQKTADTSGLPPPPAPKYPFYQAYLQRKRMEAADPGLRPPPKQEPQKESVEPQQTVGTSGVCTPQKQQRVLKDARELLNGYTLNNSAIRRFFTGHWNRHHVVAVNKLVVQIDKEQIKDVAELIKRLDEIKLVNPHGSLARRIRAIKDMNVEEASLGSSLNRK